MKQKNVVLVGVATILFLLQLTCSKTSFVAYPQQESMVRPTREATSADIPTLEGVQSTQVPLVSTPDLSKVEELFVFGNDQAVENGATNPTIFTNTEPWFISRLYTYHWNDAQGTTSLGTIALQSDNGTMYGPWNTTPEDGQGGVPNAYWIASPKITIPPGTYTVIDSDPSTWSQNKQSGGAGMVWIDGVRLSK
jgi:hypothetical protein